MARTTALDTYQNNKLKQSPRLSPVVDNLGDNLGEMSMDKTERAEWEASGDVWEGRFPPKKRRVDTRRNRPPRTKQRADRMKVGPLVESGDWHFKDNRKRLR